MGIRPIGVPLPAQDDATQEYGPKLVLSLLSLTPPCRRPYVPWNVRPFWSGLIFVCFQPVLWKLVAVIHVTVRCLVTARPVRVCVCVCVCVETTYGCGTDMSNRRRRQGMILSLAGSAAG